MKPKTGRRKDIIHIREENQLKKYFKIYLEKVNEIKSWFLKKINKIHMPLARLTK